MSPQLHRPAYVRVADRLRARILTGGLSAGARLPSEGELATKYSVSRSTVREALRQLSSQGLLTTNRGVNGGSRVVRPDPDDVAEMLTVTVTLMSQFETVTVKQLIEAREQLEVPAARLAALHRSREDVETLAGLVVPMRRGMPPRDIYEVNQAFHKAVLHASGNSVLEVLTEPLFRVLQSRFLRGEVTPTFWTQTFREHREIFEAIKKGDSVRSARRMDRHLAGLRTIYERIDTKRRARLRAS